VRDWVVVALVVAVAHGLAEKVCVGDMTLLLVEDGENVGIPLLEAIEEVADPDGDGEEDINPVPDLKSDNVLIDVEEWEVDNDTEELGDNELLLVPLKYPLPEVDAHIEGV
jgi:hypothetical protein